VPDGVDPLPLLVELGLLVKGQVSLLSVSAGGYHLAFALPVIR
jgi:hypothetical protein